MYSNHTPSLCCTEDLRGELKDQVSPCYWACNRFKEDLRGELKDYIHTAIAIHPDTEDLRGELKVSNSSIASIVKNARWEDLRGELKVTQVKLVSWPPVT